MRKDYGRLPCIARLENSSQQYAWGDTQGILPFIDARVGSGYPLSEVWMGAHERAPSKLRLDAGSLPLNELIRQAPRHWLGKRVADQYRDLPFLFKVLAARSPLSLQVHPTLSQAREGFAKEERGGIPLLAPERSFKDPNHKPELAVALTPFQAMAGFRDPHEISTLLGPELCATLNFKGRHPEELRGFVRLVFSIERDAYHALEARLRARAEELLHSNLRKERQTGAMVLDLQDLFPHDPGQFGPLVFNILALEPGDGLFVPAGVIHAYVKGSVLEIMACSDNVVRAGLTIKHIDVDLLCDTLNPVVRPVLIRPEQEHFGWGSKTAYATPAEEFRLERLEVQANPAGASPGARLSYKPSGPEILLCTGGNFRVHAENELVLPARASCFVAGSCTEVGLEGYGTLWRATSGGRAE
jgi:mannose-6-phosphate isomerase